jgi:hypothetical protein
LCFEGYCQSRKTSKGDLHTELAVSYEENGLQLLGMMFRNRYLPHFILPRAVFIQPPYKKISSTAEVFRLMQELDDVVLGKLSMEDFMKDFSEVQDEFTNQLLHPEGFVLLTPIYRLTATTTQEEGSSVARTSFESHLDEQGRVIFDYAKIKTQTYYQCHKIHQENIRSLMTLPTSVHKYYPVLKALHGFFNLKSTSLVSLVSRSMVALSSQLYQESSFVMKIDSSKAKDRIVTALQRHGDSFLNQTETAQLGTEWVLDDKDVMVVYKMILNFRPLTSDLETILVPIVADIFEIDMASEASNEVTLSSAEKADANADAMTDPQNVASVVSLSERDGKLKEEIFSFSKSLLMTVEPWTSGWQDRLERMQKNQDEVIVRLWGILNQ